MNFRLRHKFRLDYLSSLGLEKMSSTRVYTSCLRGKIVMLMLCLISIGAFPSNQLSTHYIIAFDQSVGKHRSAYTSTQTLGILNSVLKDAGFEPKSDYLSIVGYTMELGDPSIKRFVRPYVSSKGDTIKWMQLDEVNLNRLFRNWPNGEPVLDSNRSPYGSMQSLAKPFSVMETAKGDNGSHAERTILLLVSDEVVNGTDDNYRQEWNNVSTSLGANYSKFKAISSEVFNTMQNFNEEFKFVQIPIGKNKRTNIGISMDGVYKIVPYEVVSADKPSIHSVTDFPSPLPLQRVRGGFKLGVKINSLNPQYSISDITISNKKGEPLISTSDGEMNLVIPSDKVSAGDTLTTKMSLLLNDGLYNGAKISPVNPRYKDGMTSKQIVRIQDEAKVLGLFPLQDSFWWWFPNDIFTAVMIWDLIILLLVIITVGYILYKTFVRINTYKPSNDKLKITKV